MSAAADFFDVLLRYEIGLWNAVDAALRDAHTLPLGRFQALRALHGRGGNGRIQDLAGDLAITVGATSKLVDRLELDGTARRQPNPDDRRSSLISLTPEGERLRAAASATFEAALRGSLPPEDVGDLPVLTAQLERLLGHLGMASVIGGLR
jgi:DNA-binding MarR family transcriptional regulator